MKGKIAGIAGAVAAGIGGLVAYLYSSGSKGSAPYTPEQGSATSPSGQPAVGQPAYGNETGQITSPSGGEQPVDVAKIIENYKEGVLSFAQNHAVDIPSGHGHVLVYLSDNCDFQKSNVEIASYTQLIYRDYKLMNPDLPVSKQWLMGEGLDREIYSHACTRTIAPIDEGGLLHLDDQSREVFDAHMADAGAPYGILENSNVNLDDFVKQGLDILPIPLSFSVATGILYGLSYVPGIGSYAVEGLNYLYTPYRLAGEYGNKAIDKVADGISKGMERAIQFASNSMSKLRFKVNI